MRLCRDLSGRLDAIVTPTMAVPPFPVEQSYPQTIAAKPMTTYVDWIARRSCGA
jgi:amidase